MSETPLPQHLVDEDELIFGAEASRPRRRSSPPGARPVSAFAPARKTPLPAGGTVNLEDLAFISALQEAGVVSELDDAELTRAAEFITGDGEAARRIDLLVAYYEAEGDPIASRRRQAMDRWFCYASYEALTAAELVARISTLTPELESVRLERIGGADGALVLRGGEHVCALDDREDGPGRISVSVSEIVRALNVLLDRHNVRTRLVGLIGDGEREAYIGQSTMGGAIQLANADYLTAPDGKTLMQLAAW